MSYRYDNDLKFLGKCTNEELRDLFALLTRDPKDNSERITSSLTTSDEYKKYGSDYSKYWQRIAEELQLYGGNTFANIFRGSTGVLYREILEDVAKGLKVTYAKASSTQEIEDAVIEKILSDVFSKMSEEEIKEFFSEISEDDDVLKRTISSYDTNNVPWRKISMSLVRQILKAGGFATYRLSLIAVNFMWKKLFGKGLSLAMNRGLTKMIGNLLSGPIALILNAWIIADIAGPATRVTVPAVMLIATLRKKKMQNL
jgi:uncharacterized protein YaaW (UPF0174 family)